jgi:hypothetical protein
MNICFSFVFATLAMSAVAFGQTQDGAYQLGYAANLNAGDSVINITNDGARAGFSGTNTAGNICVNVYTFDPQEEELACCSCLVTPDGLNSLSAKSDLTNNLLTPAIPTSIVIKLVASVPATDLIGAYTICNPAAATTGVTPGAGAGNNLANSLQTGMLVWGTTLEPAASPGTYSPVNVGFLNGVLGFSSEQSDLTTVCNFIQSNGTGFGICNSCRLGALSGTTK